MEGTGDTTVRGVRVQNEQTVTRLCRVRVCVYGVCNGQWQWQIPV